MDLYRKEKEALERNKLQRERKILARNILSIEEDMDTDNRASW